jgi:hypothetical protein
MAQSATGLLELFLFDIVAKGNLIEFAILAWVHDLAYLAIMRYTAKAGCGLVESPPQSVLDNHVYVW